MTKYFVSGANGYLGEQICLDLHRRNINVIGLMRSHRESPRLTASGISSYSYESISQLMSENDIFIHCAGKVSDKGQWEDFEKINVDWSLSLFDRVAELGAQCFIYISSVAALGYSNRNGSEPLDEDSIPLLLDGELYGRSKLIAEKELQKRADFVSTRLVILRPGLVYGGRSTETHQSLFNRDYIIDLDQRLPMVHIDSLVLAIFLLSEESTAKGVYLVVDDEQPTLRVLNHLKQKNIITLYGSLVIGKVEHVFNRYFRNLIRKLKGLKALPEEYYEAQFVILTRKLCYSTTKLRTHTLWKPVRSLKDSLFG